MSETTTTEAPASPAPTEITPEFENEYFETRGGEIERPKPRVEPKPEPAAKASVAEPELEVTPEPKAEPHVPPARLREEADKRRAAETALVAAQQEHARQMALVNERLAQLIQPQKTQEQTPPTLEADPAGFVAYTAAQVQQLQQAEQRRQQEVQQVQYINHLEARARADAQQFMAQTPDYQDAENHLEAARGQQLKLLGVPEPQIPAMIRMEALHIAERALAENRPVAETIYNLAKSMGWAPKPAQPTEQETEVDTAAQKLETIQRGQRLSAGVPRGSAPPTGQISAQQLMSMSPDEFEAFKKRAPARFKALMGGG